MTQFIEDILPPIQSAGLNTQKAITALGTTATVAGGTSAGIAMGVAAVGLYWGSGAPTIAAGQGSLYLRTDGGVNTRVYSNTNGSTAWTPLTNAA